MVETMRLAVLVESALSNRRLRDAVNGGLIAIDFD